MRNNGFKRYHQPLHFLGGSRYLVASLEPYMDAEPKPYFSLLQRFNPWINLQEFKQQGGILVWDLNYHYAWDDESLIFNPIFPRNI